MTAGLWIGLFLTLVAGLLSGNCMLPMKFAKRWPWENTWLVFSVVSLLALPWGLAFVLIPNVRTVYSALPVSAFTAPLLFGLGWGIAQVLFGLSISRLGLALGYAIIIGLGALLGTLVPLLAKNPEIIGTLRGTVILSGVAVMVFGVIASGRAGMQRESDSRVDRNNNYALALLLAILCGLMAPMLNYAFAFGHSIIEGARRQGASPQTAGYAVWPIALLGGLIPNLLYCFALLSRNGTWKFFRRGWLCEAWYGCLMGALWMGAYAVYGVSAVYLGTLGTSVGWALFQIFMIMTATLSGVLTGEWSNASVHARRGLWVGLTLLAIATGLIASGNQQV
jgi:L-rhamnose-H+ transport protein